MSVSLEGNPGCSALGHLYRPEGDRRVCITCGHVEQPLSASVDEDERAEDATDATGPSASSES